MFCFKKNMKKTIKNLKIRVKKYLKKNQNIQKINKNPKNTKIGKKSLKLEKSVNSGKIKQNHLKKLC